MENTKKNELEDIFIYRGYTHQIMNIGHIWMGDGVTILKRPSDDMYEMYMYPSEKLIGTFNDYDGLIDNEVKAIDETIKIDNMKIEYLKKKIENLEEKKSKILYGNNN